jgi:hypothetical protein
MQYNLLDFVDNVPTTQVFGKKLGGRGCLLSASKMSWLFSADVVILRAWQTFPGQPPCPCSPWSESLQCQGQDVWKLLSQEPIVGKSFCAIPEET